MNEAYFTTLAAVAGTIISIAGSLFIAYSIHLRQRRDEYRYAIRKDLQELDELIFQLGRLEERRFPIDWGVSSIGQELSIVSEESWKSSPKGILEKEVENLQEEFENAKKEDYELGAHGPNPARRALYNKVCLLLHDLLLKFYREFPAPPGTYDLRSREGYFQSFINDDFPSNSSDFKRWARRYGLFYEEIGRCYHRVRPIVSHIARINKEALEREQELIETLEQSERLSQFQRDAMEDIKELHLREVQYYESFFHLLLRIRQKISATMDGINSYESYRLGASFKYAKLCVLAGFAGMITFGLIIPLYMLQPVRFGLSDEAWTTIMTGVLFMISALVTGWAIYRDVQYT